MRTKRPNYIIFDDFSEDQADIEKISAVKKRNNKKVKVFFTEKMVCGENIQERSYSKSPIKPLLLIKYLLANGFQDNLDIESDFEPFCINDFKIAHTSKYVSNFYRGKGNFNSNSLPWSHNLVESVKYTNSSLYNAIKYACENPSIMTLSPTSGFHHAQPSRGSGFCTFSGQVIASTKLYRDQGLVGAYLDLDGHFGNSIEDSRGFVYDLKESILMNINPRGTHEDYIKDFTKQLDILGNMLLDKKIDYVVWCHGADSHEWDSLGYQCTTQEWLLCSELFYNKIASIESKMNRAIPVTLALFGGYRDDDYESVLSLHASDIQIGIDILLNEKISYKTRVKSKKIITNKKQKQWHF